MSIDKSIIGAGGGGSEPHTPVEAPNNLKSTALIRILDLVSEGEIVGLVDGFKSVYFAETPVQNADGSYNFNNVKLDVRTGTQMQDHISGFAQVENEVGVGVELTDTSPVVRAFSNINVDAVRVRLSVAALSKTVTSGDLAGDINGYRVDYAIDVSTDGGPYVQALASSFNGKTMSKYERAHRIELPTATSGWNVRIRRITPNATTSDTQDKTYVESTTEIIDAKLRYPNSALMGVVLDAEQFQNVPSRAYDLKGRIIRVPTNYNPTTRAYATTGAGTTGGVWDGTFKLAWTDNPAWCFYDLVTHTRYGLGNVLGDGFLNKWSLYTIGQYCDQLVPDGKGGMEPRFTCNLFLQSQAEAYKVMQDMASVFRGMLYWANGEVNPVCDSPADPTYTYTPANVIGGKFQYEGSARKSRYTVALVTWNDMTNMGRATVEYVDDPEGIAKWGVQQTDATAVGCTSQGQAQRLGRYLLTTSRYETQIVTFSVGLDGQLCVPGQIIRIADPIKAGQRMGGRVVTASATQIFVDSPVTCAAGDTISVVMDTGVSETRTITSYDAVNNVVNVGVPFSNTPRAESMWVVERSDLNAQRFRVMGVLDNGDGTYSIHAVENNASKYDHVDYNTRIDLPDISQFDKSPPATPTAVTITHAARKGSVMADTVVTIHWQPGTGGAKPFRYWLWHKRDNHNWIKEPKPINGNSFDIHYAYAGTYVAKVVAESVLGKMSDVATSAPHVVPDTTLAPSQVVILQSDVVAAQAQADAAISQLSDISSDNILSAGEKKAVIQDYNAIIAEKTGLDAQATTYDVTTEKTTYDNAVTALTTYLGTLTTPVAWNNQTGSTTIVGTTFRQKFIDVYSARTALMQKIADLVTLGNLGGKGVNLIWDEYSRFWNSDLAAMPLNDHVTVSYDSTQSVGGGTQGSLKVVTTADATGSVGNTFLRFCTTAGDYNFRLEGGKKYICSVQLRPNGGGAKGAFWVKNNDGVVRASPDFNMPAANTWGRVSVILDLTSVPSVEMAHFGIYLNRHGGTTSYTVNVDQVMIEEQFGKQTTPSPWQPGAGGRIAQAAKDAATAAQTAASAAQTDATSALNGISDIANDNLLTPAEKKIIIKDQAAIVAEQAGIDTQADDFGIVTEKNTYDTAVSALNTYLATLTSPTAWNNMSGNTTIVRNTFKQKFLDVYTARQALLNAIYQAAQNLANGKVQAVGENLIPNPTWTYNDIGRVANTSVAFTSTSNPAVFVDGWVVLYDGSRTAGQAGTTQQIWMANVRPGYGAYLAVNKPVSLANNALVAAQIRTQKPIPVKALEQYLLSYQFIQSWNGTTTAGVNFQTRVSVTFYDTTGAQVGFTTTFAHNRIAGAQMIEDKLVTAPSGAVNCHVFVDALVQNLTGAAWTHDSTVAMACAFTYLTMVKKMTNTAYLPMLMYGNGRAKVPTVITYSASAGVPATATINVAAFNIISGSRTISYNAMSVGLSHAAGSVQYYLYCDDPSATGGSKTLVATTNGNDVYSDEGRVYIGDCLVSFPSSGTSSGGGGRQDSCVTDDMFLFDGLVAADVKPGMLLDAMNLPTRGMDQYLSAVEAVEFDEVECVRIETDGGAVLDCANTTPFDLLDGRSTFAPYMLGEQVVTDHGIETVVNVTPLGIKRVAHIHLGGISYAAGRDPTHRIYSHNALKP